MASKVELHRQCIYAVPAKHMHLRLGAIRSHSVSETHRMDAAAYMRLVIAQPAQNNFLYS